jgi:hypothetical protein
MSSSPLLVIDPLDAPEAGVAFHAYSAPARAILIAFFHMRVDFFLSRNDLESFVASEPVEALAFIRLTLQHMVRAPISHPLPLFSANLLFRTPSTLPSLSSVALLSWLGTFARLLASRTRLSGYS